MTEFVLNPRLVTATYPIGDLPLCRVLLLNDRRYPWVLMIPRRPGVEEIMHMEAPDRHVLIDEIAQVSKVFQDTFDPIRINIADIGNKAPQLHIHIVARQSDDEAWPAVVWSRPLEPYADAAAAAVIRDPILAALSKDPGFQRIDTHVDPGVDHL